MFRGSSELRGVDHAGSLRETPKPIDNYVVTKV